MTSAARWCDDKIDSVVCFWLNAASVRLRDPGHKVHAMEKQSKTHIYPTSVMSISLCIAVMRIAGAFVRKPMPPIDLVERCEASMLFLYNRVCIRMHMRVRVWVRVRVVHLLLREDPVFRQLSGRRIWRLNRGWSWYYEMWWTPLRQRIRLAWFVTRTRRIKIRRMLTTTGSALGATNRRILRRVNVVTIMLVLAGATLFWVNDLDGM